MRRDYVHCARRCKRHAWRCRRDTEQVFHHRGTARRSRNNKGRGVGLPYEALA